jgi:uncharacterized protein
VSEGTEYEVIDNEAERRFEIRLAEQLAIADYRIAGDTISFTHTEVPKEFEGQGIGTALVRGALDQVRARGLKVKPLCPFVAHFIDKNAAYQELLAAR